MIARMIGRLLAMHGKSLVRPVGAGTHFAQVLLLVCSLATLAAQPQTPPQRLQEAVRLMETRGDYPAAIRLLTGLTKTPDRATAARAWLYLGVAREQLGFAEAADAYRQVLANFTDQPATVAEARRRLAAVERPATAASAPTIRQLQWDDFSPSGAPSRDGRWLSGIPALGMPRNVFLVDLRSGARRQVTSYGPDAGPGVVLETAISARGDEVAFSWYSPTPDGQTNVELRVASTAGGGVRRVLSDEDVRWMGPVRWTPDGQAMLVALFHRDASMEIALVRLDGSRRALLRLTSGSGKVDLSPDGRFVVYDAPQAPDANERDVFVFDITTGASKPLVQHPANDTYPVWLSDGSGVAFVSSRTGPLSLWLVNVAAGQPSGEPRRLLSAVGRIIPLGFTADGAYYYSSNTGLVDVYTAAIDLEHARVDEPVKIVAGSIGGLNFSSSWAPDGRRLAFTSRGAEIFFQPRATAMVVHDLETGRWTEFAPPLAIIGDSAWSPDGGTLLVIGTGRSSASEPSRRGLWTIDVASGTLAPFLFRSKGLLYNPAWRNDGRAVFFSDAEDDLARRFAGEDSAARIVEREIASGTERVVATRGGFEFEVSHDGRSVAFVERGETSQSLVVAATDGSPRREVATFERSPLVVTVGWSPDDDRVVVMSGLSYEGPDTDPTEVWTVRVTDGVRRRIGAIALPHARKLRLSPDGRRLSFEAGVWEWTTWVMENVVRSAANGRDAEPPARRDGASIPKR